MSVHILAGCDADGCDARAEITDEDEQPILIDDDAGMVVDTQWMDPPDGWRIVDGVVLCPEHVAARADAGA